MTKIKCDFYNKWKHLRTYTDKLFKDNKKCCDDLTDFDLEFYNFACDLYDNGYTGKNDIITLRNLFYESNKK